MRGYGSSPLLGGIVSFLLFLTVEVGLNMPKICKFSGRRCFFSSCDFIDSLGFVFLCPSFCGGSKFTPRKIVGSCFSIFDLWARVRRGHRKGVVVVV